MRNTKLGQFVPVGTGATVPVTYHSASSRNTRSSSPNPSKHNTAETAISDLLQHLESILERHCVRSWSCAAMRHVWSRVERKRSAN